MEEILEEDLYLLNRFHSGLEEEALKGIERDFLSKTEIIEKYGLPEYLEVFSAVHEKYDIANKDIHADLLKLINFVKTLNL